jgi:hypothetical protein
VDLMGVEACGRCGQLEHVYRDQGNRHVCVIEGDWVETVGLSARVTHADTDYITIRLPTGEEGQLTRSILTQLVKHGSISVHRG